jgi:hypothetical protein
MSLRFAHATALPVPENRTSIAPKVSQSRPPYTDPLWNSNYKWAPSGRRENVAFRFGARSPNAELVHVEFSKSDLGSKVVPQTVDVATLMAGSSQSIPCDVVCWNGIVMCAAPDREGVERKIKNMQKHVPAIFSYCSISKNTQIRSNQCENNSAGFAGSSILILLMYYGCIFRKSEQSENLADTCVAYV